jgi:hypothetical protein
MENNQLQIAFERLSIIQLAAALGIAGLREGAGQKNPFRADRHAGSFSVQRSFFKDHANDDYCGGHLAFLACARPSWTKRECIEFLIREAGMEPERQPAGRVKSAQKEKRQALYKAARMEAAGIPKLDHPEPPEWSAPVRECWEAGREPLLQVAAKLADSRSWSKDALLKLAALGKTSLPLLPWSGEKANQRGWAWVVERPEFKGGSVNLVPVGYHMRYRVFPKNAPSEKRWVFVPYIPSTLDPRTGRPKKLGGIQQYLIDAQLRTPAYPFVLGDLQNPRLCLITEGQFDAVSFALAFGWLENGFPPGVAVFGLRGVQSQKAFLSAYGGLLRKHHPFCWIIGDNDTAGHKIDDFKATNEIKREPTFVDRLLAQGCAVHAELIGYEGAKDFNDVWRLAPPSVSTMCKWAAHVGAPLEIPS